MSLNHLGHLPKLLLIKNEVSMEIKYAGGFKVLLQFNDSDSRASNTNLAGGNNFEKITKDYGNIIAPFDNLTHRVDLSCVKIGILTTRRKRINKEILVAVEEEILKMGIIEFDEDWYAFKFDPNDDFYKKDELCVEDEDEEEEDDVDGVSETWV
ncbi:unnamed protein product [Lactuca virosa]|uniref:Uncharacterized protein n=1 Tax=Lactuca virosa TaxID=75947 RepID=A0AAU9P4U3_9ASTR|nr:unnamed protein product [Lactuca virosa]